MHGNYGNTADNGGVQSHSRPVKPGNWCIFEANCYPKEVVHAALLGLGIAHKVLVGKWEGRTHPSYLVHEDDWPSCHILTTGEKYCLKLNTSHEGPFRIALICAIDPLTPHDPAVELTGWFVETGREYAEKQPGYTYDPSEERWWTLETEYPKPYVQKQRAIKPLMVDGNPMP